MTRYSEFINAAKSKCERTWLTPSQANLLNRITVGLSAQRVIDVYGREGTGKTFLGWILEKEHFGKYFVDVDSLKEFVSGNPNAHESIVIVDNFPSSREYHRSFRGGMGILGISRAVVLTESAIPDDIPKLELEFNDVDRRHFKHTCYDKLRVFIQDEKEEGNMHELIRNAIWGEANV